MFILQEADATQIDLYIALHLILLVISAQTPCQKNIYAVKDVRGVFLLNGNIGYPNIGRRRYWEPSVRIKLIFI